MKSSPDLEAGSSPFCRGYKSVPPAPAKVSKSFPMELIKFRLSPSLNVNCWDILNSIWLPSYVGKDQNHLLDKTLIFVYYIKISNKEKGTKTPESWINFFPPDWKHSEKINSLQFIVLALCTQNNGLSFVMASVMSSSDRLGQGLNTNKKRQGKKNPTLLEHQHLQINSEDFQVFLFLWSQLIHNNDTLMLYLLVRLKGM